MIAEHATEYYKNLFGPTKIPTALMDPDYWGLSKKISDSKYKELIRTFSLEEIKGTVFSMEKNTAPGPDHLHTEFYQKSEIIRDDVYEMFKEFHDQKQDIRRFNYGVITLLPIIKNAINRLICLLNVIYKIFTKTHMLRFEKVMGKVINKCQYGCIKEKTVMDGFTWNSS